MKIRVALYAPNCGSEQTMFLKSNPLYLNVYLLARHLYSKTNVGRKQNGHDYCRM